MSGDPNDSDDQMRKIFGGGGKISPEAHSESGDRQVKPDLSQHDGVGQFSDTDAAFTGEDANERNGNYIIAFGLAQSGKSTFHNMLLRYLEQVGPFAAQLQIPKTDDTTDFSAQAMVNVWRESWLTNTLPPANPVTEEAIREVIYFVKPNSGVRDPVRFGIVEVSGELLRNVVATSEVAPQIPLAIHNLFRNNKVRPILLFIINPENPRNDLLFENFVTYLDRSFPGRRNTIPLGLIVANPDAALALLKERSPEKYKQYSKLEGRLVFEYLRMATPRTYNQFQAWPNKKAKMISPLYIGDIMESQTIGYEGARAPRRYIKGVNFGDVSKIFSWIYLQCTGKHLGPTWVQRIVKRLKQAP